MAIKDLQARQGNVTIDLLIIEVAQVREFEKFGKKGRVCNAKGKDNTGNITLSLWNEDIDKVKAGDNIRISNGWVSEWQGELQLSTGKFGKIEILESGVKNESPAAKEEENSEIEPDAEKKVADGKETEAEDLEELGEEEEFFEEEEIEDK